MTEPLRAVATSIWLAFWVVTVLGFLRFLPELLRGWIAYQKRSILWLTRVRDLAAEKLREIDKEAQMNTATVEQIRNLEWCCEVLLLWPACVKTDNLVTNSVIQMPKDCQPAIGDKISFTSRDEVLWKGKLIAVDQRPMRRKEDGDADLG